MGYSITPIAAVSGFWFFVGLIVPCFIRKGPNRGIVQCSLLLTAICAWLMYMCTYLVQMNPLIGPQLKRNYIMGIAKEWGNHIDMENGTES